MTEEQEQQLGHVKSLVLELSVYLDSLPGRDSVEMKMARKAIQDSMMWIEKVIMK